MLRKFASLFASIIIGLTSLVVLSAPAEALGTDGTADSAFNSSFVAANLGFSEVTAIATQSTGKILVGGLDSSYLGKLVRINADGTNDATFPTTTLGVTSSDGRPGAIVVNSDDSFYVTGYFHSVTQGSAVPSANVAKFNSAGTVDGTFGAAVSDSTTGLLKYSTSSSTTNGMAIDSTGRIILAGMFYSTYQSPWNSAGYIGLIRLNTDGSVDTTFHPYSSNFVSVANTVLITSNDAVVAAGGFGSQNLVKVLADGTVDPSFTSTISSSVYAVVEQADGKFIVGGGLDQDTAFLGRITATGANDSSFVAPPMTSVGTYPTVNSLAIQSDGKIIAAGSMPQQLMRLSASGTNETPFASNFTASGFVGYADIAVLQTNGEILVGGSISSPGVALVLYTAAQFTITYAHGTGGTGSDLVQTIAQGSSITLPSPTACPASATNPCFTAPTGQRANNWQVTSGTISGGGTFPMTGASITPTSNVTLAARWTGGPVQYSTTSFSSGGTAMSSIAFPNTVVNSSSQITLYAHNSGTAATSISNETIAGSGVSRQGGTCNVSGGTILAGGECTVILQWNPTSAGNLTSGSYQMQVSGQYFDAVTLTGLAATNKTVIFNANSGSGTMSNQVSAFSANLTTNTFTRTGYTFSGWNTSADGTGSSYSDGAMYLFNSNTTMYAQWVTNGSGGGGSGSGGSSGGDGSMAVTGPNAGPIIGLGSALLALGIIAASVAWRRRRTN